MNRLVARLRTRATVFIHDLVMIPLAWLGAYWLRFNLGDIPEEYLVQALEWLPWVLVLQGAMFWYHGLYRGVWRFASMPDLARIVQAVTWGVALFGLLTYLFGPIPRVPRSVYLLDFVLLVALLGGPRFVYRWVKDRRLTGGQGKQALIVGAGRAGEMLARDLLRDPGHTYRPVAFVDDDLRKKGKDIHGLPVIGGCDDIPAVVARHGIELILLALPSATPPELRRIVELCERTGVAFRILPRMQDLVTGQVSLKELRDVQIDDLLGRAVVSLDWNAITAAHRGKTILISGGGGSIGSELCRQIARLDPARLIVLERNEYNLYRVELELLRLYPRLPLSVVLGDVGDALAVERLLQAWRPQVVFHAAAYKHVPMLEDQVRAAVVNNVLATRTLAAACDRHGCESFVMISTDKAVNPGNVMGTTKRVAELYCQGLNLRSRTRFITVRFGNVLGSTGSVIPLFQQQIAAGGPVTVTDPEVTRYFMTTSEAAQLILQAGVLGRGGEIFVLDMGEPIKISYLAEQLIRLSGKRPGEDIAIVYTGLRPGEKLSEELFHDVEALADTTHPKIRLAQGPAGDLEALERGLAALERACEQPDEGQLRALLATFVADSASVPARRTAGRH
jgi:FlaA1/EpsC-like NDP-sugar epimerase